MRTSDERREVAARLRKTRGIMAFVDALGIEYTAGEGIWIEDHVINADVTQQELDGKAAVGHTHVIADVDGLQAALDGKGVRLGTRVTDGNLEISIA